jgi:putative ABC transport system permease protein
MQQNYIFTPFFQNAMLLNYLTIALRSLRRNATYSFINIVGLAIGIAVCALITLYVVDELSFDRFHANADRIYRVDSDVKFQGQQFSLAAAAAPMGATIKADIPEVEDFTRFRTLGAWNFQYDTPLGTKVFREENVAFADSSLFNVFTVPVVQGNGVAALAAMESAVLTEECAQKYFGTENPIGKRLKGDNGKYYTVGAVIKRLPANSHFRFDVLLSMTSYADSKSPNWTSNNYVTYVLLKKGVNAASVNAKFPTIVQQYLAPALERDLHIPYAKFEATGSYFKYTLFPMTQIHLHSGNKLGELAPNGSIQHVWIFSCVAVFVLFIACVNFMNLATARATNRAKEVGIRKTLGSRRIQLVAQFLAESSLMVACALVVAFCLVEIALPAFNDLASKELSRAVLHTPAFVGVLAVLFVVVSVFAGAYPAFVLSAFQPVKVLKGNKSSGSRNNFYSLLRSTLVVVQFAASVVLVIGTIVIFNQLRYIQSKSLGFNREQVLVVNDADTRPNGAVQRFKQEIMRLQGVKMATVTNYLPTGGWRNNSLLWTGKNDLNVAVQQWDVDADYIPTMGMTITKGRNFDARNIADSATVILSETAAQKFFGNENPLGKIVESGLNNTSRRAFTVIGVVQDFHYESLREQIQPLAMFFGQVVGSTSIRFDATAAASVLASVESVWKRLNPDKPFEYRFLDEQFSRIYRTEQRTGTILGVFTALAIGIACLGLFGLAAFAAETRTKEIGIRKVLGASVASIVALLSKDFLKLVAVAIVVATPLAWWAMKTWLQDFAYRAELSWWVFAAAGALAVVIALATVSVQAWRAARANPVNALRSE